VNFVLGFKTTSAGEQPSFPIDYAITYGIQQGVIAGQIYVQQTSDSILSTEIVTYDGTIGISTDAATAERYEFTINGTENSTGRILVIRFGPGTLQNTKNMTVLYDNETIPWVDFDTLYKGKLVETNNSTAVWTNVLTIDQNGDEIVYFLLRIPHYSTHTITITTIHQIIEAVGGPLAVLVYVAIGILVTVMFVYPVFAGTIRLKRKE
jgi:hypothetical protein